MDDDAIRARRAAGESLHSIARDLGVSHVTVARRSWGSRSRPKLADSDRSYVVHKNLIGKCSSDYAVIPISLARSAA